MFVKHATKGRLVYIDGKLQTRRWSKPDEDGDRFSTEILLVPGGRVQFLDKPNGNGAPAQADPAMAGDTGAAAPADIRRRVRNSVLAIGRHRFVSSLPTWPALRCRPFFLQPIPSETRSGAAPARCAARRPSGAGRRRRPAGIGRPARNWKESRMQHEPSPAAGIAAALGAARRSRLPALPAARPPAGPLLGRRRPRRRPRAVALRPPSRSRACRGNGPTPRRGSTATCSTSSAIASGAPTLRAALDEARAFLALPATPATGSRRRLRRHRSGAPPVAAMPRHRRHPCRALSARARAVALPLRGAALPSRASLSRRLVGAPVPGAGRRRHRQRRRRARRTAHLARSAPPRQGGRG